MRSDATTVQQYLAELPEDRRAIVSAVREVVLGSLPEGYEETVSYGMIGYVVPHRLYPPGYHCDPKLPLPFANLASQKNHCALYLYYLYSDAAQIESFRDAWRASGKKLDMGKSCVRFKKLDDVPLEVIADAIRRVPVEAFVAQYKSARRKRA